MSSPFHLHVYFQSAQQHQQALRLREAAGLRFPSAVLGRVHEQPVAFHPAPMFQVSLPDVDLGTLIAWVDRNRGGLSVLAHPLTGDPVREHTLDAIWLGPPLELDHARLVKAASAAQAPPSQMDGPVLLRIDASARYQGSIGRGLADSLQERLQTQSGLPVLRRDLALGLPLLDPEFLSARVLPTQDLSPAQAKALATSDTLIAELKRAQSLLLVLPIYNFQFPAAFKAWFDLVARAGLTFSYTKQGPMGLLPDRPVHLVITSGGTRLGSPADFALPWLKHALGFIGLRDLRVIEADGLVMDAEGRMAHARAQIARARWD